MHTNVFFVSETIADHFTHRRKSRSLICTGWEGSHGDVSIEDDCGGTGVNGCMHLTCKLGENQHSCIAIVHGVETSFVCNQQSANVPDQAFASALRFLDHIITIYFCSAGLIQHLSYAAASTIRPIASSTLIPTPNCSIASCALGTPIRARLRGTTTSCTSKQPNATSFLSAGQLLKIPAITLVSTHLQKLMLMCSSSGYNWAPLKTVHESSKLDMAAASHIKVLELRSRMCHHRPEARRCYSDSLFWAFRVVVIDVTCRVDINEIQRRILPLCKKSSEAGIRSRVIFR